MRVVAGITSRIITEIPRSLGSFVLTAPIYSKLLRPALLGSGNLFPVSINIKDDRGILWQRCRIKNLALLCVTASMFLGISLRQSGAEDTDETKTVLGCIERTQQKYVVVDSHGVSYLLDGVGNELSGEVGHTLEVKGKLIHPAKPSRRSGRQNTNRNSGANASPPLATLQVENVISDVHRLGDHCPNAKPSPLSPSR